MLGRLKVSSFKKAGRDRYEVTYPIFERNLIVLVEPKGLVLKGKGTSRTLRIDWQSVVYEAAQRSSEIPGGFRTKPLEWLLRK